MKSVKQNEKGYFLLESLAALSLISLMLMIYIPFTVTLLQRMEEEKMEVEMTRILYDCIRRETDSQTVKDWKTGKWTFTIQTDFKNSLKGVSVKDGEGTKEKHLQVVSVQWNE